MKRCVLSLATKDKHYAAGPRRLRESVERSGFTGEFMGWPPGSFPAGCPTHQEVPFAFKPYCFQEARQQGVKAALWMDVSRVLGWLDGRRMRRERLQAMAGAEAATTSS
jgi:hypothetical protein